MWLLYDRHGRTCSSQKLFFVDMLACKLLLHVTWATRTGRQCHLNHVHVVACKQLSNLLTPRACHEALCCAFRKSWSKLERFRSRLSMISGIAPQLWAGLPRACGGYSRKLLMQLRLSGDASWHITRLQLGVNRKLFRLSRCGLNLHPSALGQFMLLCPALP